MLRPTDRLSYGHGSKIRHRSSVCPPSVSPASREHRRPSSKSGYRGSRDDLRARFVGIASLVLAVVVIWTPAPAPGLHASHPMGGM